MKRYRLFMNLGVIMMYVVPPVMAVLGALIVYLSITNSAGNEPPLPFAVMWLGMVSWFWFLVLRMPHIIDVHEDGRLEFISRVRRWSVSPHQITYVGPERGQIGFLVVRSSKDKIRLINQFNGFHRFLTELEKSNPAIEFRGC